MSVPRKSEPLKPESLAANARAKALLDKALLADPPRLDLAALAVCALENPDVDVRQTEWMLEALAVQVTSALKGSRDPLDGLEALRKTLGEGEKFRGDSAQIAKAESSFLDRALELRTGLPITLSVIYLEVARRAGIPLYGVSFPGHFVVAAQVGQGTLVLDPFHSGMLLTESGCERLLRQVAPQLKFQPRMLRPASAKTITYRLLGNLKRLYMREGNGPCALRVIDLMLRISPDHPGDLRARAAILSTLGAYRAALADIERCLKLSPSSPDHTHLLITAKALRERVESLN
jgi:regulator of sirC expression with transglutaminase-like and TPR domain